MSIAKAIRDNDGSNPCLPPHILGRVLDKLRERMSEEKNVKIDPWAWVDRLAKDIKAAK